MQVPAVFIDISLEDQAVELRKYFKALGADISEEKSANGVEDDLHRIVAVCDTCFKEQSEADVEAILNSIVSIMVSIPLEKGEELIRSFAQRLTNTPGPKMGVVAVQSLWRLYNNLESNSPLRYHVYYYVIELAARVGFVRDVFTGVEQLKKEFADCPPSNEQMQKLYRLLHQVLKDQHSDLASKVMIELLGTYTDDNASHAREDAIKCIATALADPNTFLLDPLLSLTPVKVLEGQPIYELLNIFVSEKLSSYQAFYKKNQDFVKAQGLNHEQNVKKMRILTFMQMAESNPEISFDDIISELQINESDVEAFIIEVLKTRLVRARMDQAARSVRVSSTMHRTFGRAQWAALRGVLQAWRGNLHAARDAMLAVTAAQLEFAQQGTKAVFRPFVCAALSLLVGLHAYAYFWGPQDSIEGGFNDVKYVVMELTRGLSEVNRKHERLQDEMRRMSSVLPAVTAAAGRARDAVEPAVLRSMQQAGDARDYDRQIADYALETAGGKIVDTGDTVDHVGYESPVGWALHALAAWLCRECLGARAMIRAGALPGECWAFKGSTGEATIRLSGPVRVTGISIEHIPAHISPTKEISSAPRLVQIEAAEFLSDPYPHSFGSFEYNKKGKPIQYFEVLHPSPKCYNYVKVRILSNWGHPTYTCVYRVRIHGEMDGPLSISQ